MKADSRVCFQVKASRIDASGISDPGVIGYENEDSIWLDKSGNFLLIADGMGGHEHDGEASKTAIKVIREYLEPEFIRREAALGLMKAGLLVFVMAIAEFGNPAILGGRIPFLLQTLF